MKNNAIFARKCEINYQMWIKKKVNLVKYHIAYFRISGAIFNWSILSPFAALRYHA